MIFHKVGHCYEAGANGKPAKHNKIWGYLEDPKNNTFITFWGRVNAVPQLTLVGTGYEAQVECEKLWRSKSKKYRELNEAEYQYFVPQYEELLNA